MKTKAITFGQFESVLKELGFRRRSVPGTGIAYVRPDMKEFLLVRFHKSSEEVPWHVLAPARRHLDSWGIIDAADFDAMLQSAAA
jgi:hypothetical protein